jgi:hypothetical protein
MEQMPIGEDVRPFAHLRGDETARLVRTEEGAVRFEGVWPKSVADWWSDELERNGYVLDKSRLTVVPD